MQNLKSHPDFLFGLEVYRKLNRLGYKTYFAGGCVRDLLMGRPCRDIDLATSAKPSDVIKNFDKVIDIGKDFGSVKVINGLSQIDVTTFRSDGEYQDGRHPEGVLWSSEKEDAERRDFTINSLFWDADSDKVIDFVNGQNDIKRKLIQTNGHPLDRFKEDYLRMIRAVRFHYQLNFNIDESVISSVLALKDNIRHVSKERITDEMNKIFFVDSLNFNLEVLNKTQILRPLGMVWSEDIKSIFFSCRLTNFQDVVFRWFEFFVFLFLQSKKQIFEYQDDFFIFTADQKKILKFMGQKFQEILNFQNINKGLCVGEWIELSYEKTGAFLIDFLSFHKILPTKLSFLTLKANLNKSKPQPVLKFKDIENKKFKSAAKVLKYIYWKQLEGVINNKNEALVHLDNLNLRDFFSEQ